MKETENRTSGWRQHATARASPLTFGESMKFTICLFFAFMALGAKAADDVALQDKNDWDGISATISPKVQEMKQGDELRFNVTYEFKRMYRAMNIFALTHNHPYPTSELRFFREDNTFFAILRANGFAGNFPNHEYLMYPDSSISFTTSVSTKSESAIFPREIPPGVYQVQLATYDKISLGFWARKESPAKPVLFSNVVTCTILAK